MGSRYALLVGVDKFADPLLGTLTAPKADIHAFGEALKSPDLGAFSEVRPLLNPSKTDFEAAVHWLFRDRNPEDTVLFYFSGHGILFEKGKDTDLYFALEKTDAAAPYVGSLRAREVRDWIGRTKADNQIFILDCCHSAAFSPNAKAPGKGQRVDAKFGAIADCFKVSGKGTYLISACTRYEHAFEENSKSVFTEILVEGITSGKAAPNKPVISVEDLYQFVLKEISSRNQHMSPAHAFSGTGERPIISKNRHYVVSETNSVTTSINEVQLETKSSPNSSRSRKSTKLQNAKAFSVKKAKPVVVRDPVHGLIGFGTDAFEHMLWRLVQTQPFQRLRRLKQLGFSETVYPGATHSRFAHSLGVFHTARTLVDIVHKKFSDSKKGPLMEPALTAALVHDVGHGPFSHAFERFGKELKIPALLEHEMLSVELIRSSEIGEIIRNEYDQSFIDGVVRKLDRDQPARDMYSPVVSSQFDADRLDYMRRDQLMTGTGIGKIDFEWLINNLEIAEIPSGVDGDSPLGTQNTFVIGKKGIPAAEGYVLGLFHLYPTVYLHKTTRGMELLFLEFLLRMKKLVEDGLEKKTGLRASHPLIKLIREREKLQTNFASVAQLMLQLDDTVMWSTFGAALDCSDTVLFELANRLLNRKLYRHFDLREAVKDSLHMSDHRPGSAKYRKIDDIVNLVCSKLQMKVDVSHPSIKAGERWLLLDETRRSPYKRVDRAEDSGASRLNQINVRIDQNNVKDIIEVSSGLSALTEFRLLRAYYDEAHPEVLKFLQDSLKQEVENANRT